MARAVTTQRKTIATAAAWIVALLIFFPILWTILTTFKSEQEAIQGFNLIPSGTLESYFEVQAQSGYFQFFLNSVIIVGRLDHSGPASSPFRPPGRWRSRRPSGPRTS